ncbi:MAG: amidohydrolase family protein [Gemmatimonadota bacterium]
MKTRSSVALAALVCTLGCASGEPAADLAIMNVTVVDASDGARSDQTVLVSDGRITAVGPDVEANADVVVDGAGRYLIPGLWDFHVHFTYDERFTDAMGNLFLHHGITSVRDTGGPLDQLLPVVQSLKAEGALAPRVFFAGPLLDGEFVVYDGEYRPLLGIGNPDPETARANVARLADAGVDFLKIYEMVSPAIFEVLVSEAEARGLPMDGHVPLAMRARDVGPRVQSLEHLRNIEMDCVADAETLAAERRNLLQNPDGVPGADLRSTLHDLNRLAAVAAYDEAECDAVLEAMTSTIQVPTLRLNALGLHPPFERADWGELLDKLPEEAGVEWRAATEASAGGAPMRDPTYAEWSLFLIGRMDEAGVPIGAGTDTPIGFAAPGYSLHSELEMLVRAGLTPLEALESATVRPAEFFGLEAEMGSVAVGQVADLVLLGADPLADIVNTRTVEAVVTKGRLLDRAALDQLVR